MNNSDRQDFDARMTKNGVLVDSFSASVKVPIGTSMEEIKLINTEEFEAEHLDELLIEAFLKKLDY